MEQISPELFDEIVIEDVIKRSFGERFLKNNDKKYQTESGSKDQISNLNKKIWIPKAIGVVSTNPYYEFFSNILLDIYFTMIIDPENMTGPIIRGTPFNFEHIIK